MDVQPLIVMLSGEGHQHGFSHTHIGASLLAVFAALSGKYLSEIGFSDGDCTLLRWLIVSDHSLRVNKP
ncbi:hypothetical protein [Bowmanella yangjiangensis]|uniref:hypothetical protein n=1 Tax=Bowmanella yangjiangensis TaxID=2811230 RepID=UPI001E48EDE7|nr:hypothetical protein [Bowmanella yangjiangensis]